MTFWLTSWLIFYQIKWDEVFQETKTCGNLTRKLVCSWCQPCEPRTYRRIFPQSWFTPSMSCSRFKGCCVAIPHRLDVITNWKDLHINKENLLNSRFKRVGWLNMPLSPSSGECCMAIKTYGRHNLWKPHRVGSSGRPFITTIIFCSVVRAQLEYFS